MSRYTQTITFGAGPHCAIQVQQIISYDTIMFGVRLVNCMSSELDSSKTQIAEMQNWNRKTSGGNFNRF